MSRPVLSAYRWHASHGLSDTHDNDQEEACDDGSAHGGPADDNDVGGVFRVCVGVEESARSAPLMWGVFDEPLTDHDLLVLSRAFDFSDGLREHCVPAAWEALDSTLDSGVRELVSHPPRTEAELAAAIAGLGHAVARRAVDGALDRLQSRWL